MTEKFLPFDFFKNMLEICRHENNEKSVKNRTPQKPC